MSESRFKFVQILAPRAISVLLVCATFPLIWIGGLVTTYDAGMAVPDWPNTYGYNMFLYPLATWLEGPWVLFIEHGHRLLAAFVGLLTIGLAMSVWCFDRRRWMRLVSLLAIVAVVAQGVLGGMRVNLDANSLARIHGCTGPLFFAMAVSMAVFTSKSWSAPRQVVRRGDARRFQVQTGLVAFLSLTQIVLGANLRHLPIAADPHMIRSIATIHVWVALVLTAAVLWLTAKLFSIRHQVTAVFLATMVLTGLVLAQLGLGLAAWTVKYSWPIWLPHVSWATGMTVGAESRLQVVTVTMHVAVGSLILAASVVLLLRMMRMIRPTTGDEHATTTTSLGVAL